MCMCINRAEVIKIDAIGDRASVQPNSSLEPTRTNHENLRGFACFYIFENYIVLILIFELIFSH